MEENKGYIYKITNLVNGKLYIGQTKLTIKRRFYDHIRYSKYPNRQNYNCPLYRAFRKYGVSDNSIKKWCKRYGLPHTKREINKLTNEERKKI